MPFSQSRRYRWFTALLGPLILGLSVLAGCKDDITHQGEVSAEAAQRVAQNLRPALQAESAVVMRNLVNILTALPEVCSTPLADLGNFTSSFPALGKPLATVFDDEDGQWSFQWQNVLLGDDDGQGTTSANAARVELTLTVTFEAQDGETLRAVPLALLPQSSVFQTTGDPPSRAAGNLEGFFLSQDAMTGVWTLRWRALGTSKVFAGTLNNAGGFTRLIRCVASQNAMPTGFTQCGTAANGEPVTSLGISDNTSQVTFRETTAPGENKGFTFYVRPGERVQFRLRLGPVGEDPQEITRAQLRIGGQDQEPPIFDPEDGFLLASNLPVNPGGRPNFTPGADVGTFIWQDVANNTCTAGREEQWRIRFSHTAPVTFSGEIGGGDEEDDRPRVSATAVGGCAAANVQDGGAKLVYACVPAVTQESGYDICATAGNRLRFEPRVNDVRDSSRVFLGSRAALPPSPDPFSILVEAILNEVPGSGQALGFINSRMMIRGNDSDTGALKLNPEQISLDPLCSLPGELVQPRVRLIDTIDYTTSRFVGSRASLEDVEFTFADASTNTPVTTLRGFPRFPDRGVILLQTRVGVDNTEIRAPMDELTSLGTIQVPLTFDIRVNDVLFKFGPVSCPNALCVDLTVE